MLTQNTAESWLMLMLGILLPTTVVLCCPGILSWRNTVAGLMAISIWHGRSVVIMLPGRTKVDAKLDETRAQCRKNKERSMFHCYPLRRSFPTKDMDEVRSPVRVAEEQRGEVSERMCSPGSCHSAFEGGDTNGPVARAEK